MKYNTENLSSFKSNFKNTPTKLIRVPCKYEEEITEIAIKIDQGKYKDSEIVIQELKNILIKIENKDKGYKSNSSGLLINDLKNIVNKNT